MERMQPIEFLLSSLAVRTNHSALCFDRCVAREALQKELSREQEHCLGNCWGKYQQAQKVVTH